MKPMTKRQRLEATISGEPVDRPAVSLWRHWPGDDQHGGELARATLDFQQTFDFDFIKVTPDSNYCVEGYGAESLWDGNPEGSRVKSGNVIQRPDDWLALRPLDPNTGLLAEVLEANRAIGESLGDETPYIQTIFHPLSQAKYLAGNLLLTHLRTHPDALNAGLAALTESTLRFIEALKETGVSGIFLAIQHASYDLLTEEEYRTICRPLDLQILEAAGDLWLNVIHLHGEHVMFDVVADYPAQVINWHDTETPPSLAGALTRTRMALCGGLRQWSTMVRGTPDTVRAEALAAMAATGGRRFILGTGCVTPIVAPTSNLRAARNVVAKNPAA